MFSIAGALLVGWIMGLFGFKGVVIAGMAQLFGVTLTSLGYYFLFALFGAVNHFILVSKRVAKIDSNFDKFLKGDSKLKK